MCLQARSILESPSCGCKPINVGYESIATGTCCSFAMDSSEGKDVGSGNICAKKGGCCGGDGGASNVQKAASCDQELLNANPTLRVAGKCASRKAAGDPDLLVFDDTDPACCGP